MKSLLKTKEIAFNEIYEEIFKIYPKQEILSSAEKLLKEVKNFEDFDYALAEKELNDILSKNETFNTLMTLLELEKKAETDISLFEDMKDPAYNQHRAMAMSICDMYSSGATSFFGYVDCTFRKFFPNHKPKSFLAKGICALIASVAEVIVTGDVKEDYTKRNLALLEQRGVTLNDLLQLVYQLQKPYNVELVFEECERHILGVLRKQQTFHTINLCVYIDEEVEKGNFGEQFLSTVGLDEGLYGIDEVVNTSISKMYGSIAYTNFGYLDKEKPGIIGALDSDHEGNRCNTFLDDTVCGIVSAACSRLAHNNANTTSKPTK